MNTVLIVTLAVVIPVVGVGLYIILKRSGYFQYMGGKKRSSILAVNKETLMGRLLNLTDLGKSFTVLEAKDTDLVAEWKGARGRAISGDLSQLYRACLLLDESRHTVRSYEEIGSVEKDSGKPVYWRLAGGPRPSKAQGKEDAGSKSPLQKIRQPMVSMVRESGWEWVTVVAKKHAVKPATRQDTI